MTSTRQARRINGTTTGHEIVLELISTKWSLPILTALADQPVRRKQIKRQVRGINDDRLDATLTRHLRSGLVARDWIAGPRADEPGYALTPLGRSLLRALEPLAAWQHEHLGELVENRRRWDRSHPASAG